MLKNKLKKIIAMSAIVTSIAAFVTALPAMAANSATYTGSQIRPAINLYDDSTDPATLLVENEDYTLDYGENINVGTGYIYVTYIGNYIGNKTIPFPISAKALSQSDVTIAAVDNQTFTGSEIEPKPEVKYGDRVLVEDTDFDFGYSNNTDVGTGNISVTFKGNYSGSAASTFEIVPKTLGQDDITVLPIDDVTFTGSPLTPEPTVKYGDVTLIKDTDYTLDYNNNTNVGTGEIEITFTGNYAGGASATFNIVAKSLSNSDITVDEVPAQTFTGSAIEPKPAVKYGDVTLIEGEDYNLTYGSNTNVGTGHGYIEFIGNYTNEGSFDFAITAKPLTKDDLTCNIPDEVYTGEAIEPHPVIKYGDVTLVEGTDYDLSYDDNTDVGTATMHVILKGNYSGNPDFEFNIIQRTLTNDNVTIGEIEPPTYNRGAQTPKPEVKLGNTVLIEGTDFDFEYDNNINAGDEAVIRVVGKGMYDGSAETNFTIKRKDGSNFTYYIIFFDED